MGAEERAGAGDADTGYGALRRERMANVGVATEGKDGEVWRECAIRTWIDAEWVGQAGGVLARWGASDYRTPLIHEKIS